MFRVFRIILTHAAKYVTNVESYDRRIQAATNIQGKKMQRRAEFLLTRALRQAGYKNAQRFTCIDAPPKPPGGLGESAS